MKINHKESIKDFGKQFQIDNKIDEYHGSTKLIKDTVSPFNLNSIKNKIIMEVGSGSGRILKNLLKFNPKRIYSVEPSDAIEIAKKNNNSTKITYKKIKGENIKYENKFDYIFSIGVIHHIPNYQKVCERIYHSLKNNGKFICWVYGYEGNELYLIIFDNLRRITIKLPDFILRFLCNFFNLVLYPYIYLCKVINLPLRDYLINVFDKCSYQKRNYIIFDQLNPSFTKYFKKKEIVDLMYSAGFKKVSVTRRHNYSWTLIATKEKV